MIAYSTAYKTPDKRNAVLQTASALFAKYGYQAVGVDKIIAESRVAKMTMYRHFPTKDKLVVEVLRNRTQTVQAALEKRIRAQKTAEGKIKAIFAWYDQWLTSSTFHGCMFMHAASEYGPGCKDIHDVVNLQKKNGISTICAILREAGFTSAQAKRLASALVMLLDGAIIAAEVMNNRNAASEAWRIAKMLLERH